ncbi:MAG: Hsp70 family protein [Rhodospirillales bacterium]
MAQARFGIGIDLGTTNSAMAFVPLTGDAPSEVFRVAQWEAIGRVAEVPTLPSFLYLPEDAAVAALRGAGGDWVVGRLARTKAAEVPGRVVHSAKSWLCHHTSDRAAAFLPWGSPDLGPERKISPIRASALILGPLRAAWDDRFAAAGSDFRFDAQVITVTVPASFDAAAQSLTLEAAAEAGFPDTVRLLEEPQAAFYRWLERHPAMEALPAARPGAEAVHVLVVDIGGGTSDFSLFAVRRGGAAEPAEPAVRRIAVSDHILLGGDNVDLALAHRIESRVADGGKLSGGQWETLVARCRDLKERALAADGPPDQVFPLAIPGRGAGLIGGALAAAFTRGEIEAVLLDGFFPECDAEARPYRTRTALKEWGLPFAADSAVTRHLADFLRDRPAVDAVLFNGGALYPQRLRARLVAEIGKWQDGDPPVALDNPEPDLAVACGAARSSAIRHRRAQRIEAGAARAVFLEVHGSPAGGRAGAVPPALVCVLPRGASPDQAFEIADRPLALRVNRPVRFQAHSTTRHGRSQAGDVVAWNDHDFQPLPALETVAAVEVAEAETARRTVPVALTARLNELGLLQVACVSTDPSLPATWPLHFNLRPHERDALCGPAAVEAGPNADPAAVTAADARIRSLFGQPPKRKDPLSATRLLASLEKILGAPKGEWNWVLVRALWPALEASMGCRQTSIEHEEAWLILAGFLLRPGFGAPLDAVRIDGVWRLRESGLCFPGKRIRLQEWILWRRLAGGLSRQRQEAVLAPELGRVRSHATLPPELVRLAGALERLGPETKTELVRRFLAAAGELAGAGRHCAPFLAALGLLLNRAPLYAGPETVVSPELVEEAWDAFERLDWTHPELVELHTLFLRAARVVDNRALDVPKALRNRIAGKLEKAGVAPSRTAKIREALPIERADRLALYGEALPPGLILGQG